MIFVIFMRSIFFKVINLYVYIEIFENEWFKKSLKMTSILYIQNTARTRQLLPAYAKITEQVFDIYGGFNSDSLIYKEDSKNE